MKIENPSNSNKHLEAMKMPWTEIEVSIAKKFLDALNLFSGTFREKMNRAANSIGYYNGYDSMPKGVKSYISHTAAEAKKRKAANEKLLVSESMEDEWWEQFHNDPDFRRAMTHPDDEE